MITKCPVCKKEYDVLYPDKWAYKRGTTYYCSWKCLRTLDKPNDKGEKAEVKRRDITLEEKKKAVQIALAGKSPLEYLEGLGVKNAAQAWYGIKNKLKETDPDLYKRLPKKNARRDRTVETPEGVIFNGKQYEPMETPPATAAEAMEGMKAAADEFFSKCEDMGLRLDKEPEPTVYTMADPPKVITNIDFLPVCGVRSRVLPDRKFLIDSDSGEMYLDHDGAWVKLSAGEWKVFSREILTAIEQLGVEQ